MNLLKPCWIIFFGLDKNALVQIEGGLFKVKLWVNFLQGKYYRSCGSLKSYSDAERSVNEFFLGYILPPFFSNKALNELISMNTFKLHKLGQDKDRAVVVYISSFSAFCFCWSEFIHSYCFLTTYVDYVGISVFT